MLAFVTISFMGQFLVGIAMLSAEGLAGTAVYVVGDGLVKAALFVCVGIVQHRRASIDEVDLHGRGRDLPLAGIVFGVGALAVAGLPPFGPFLGKALVEDAAATGRGLGWVPVAMMLAAALSAGALVRAGARVFLGLGEPGVPDESSDEASDEAEPETDKAHDRTPALMSITAVGLLAGGLAWGLIPGLADSALHAASRFVEPNTYAAVVLHGGHEAAGSVLSLSPSTSSYLYGLGAVLGALLVGGAGVLRLSAVDVVRPVFVRLRTLHSGHVGDYIAWLTSGVALIGLTFALTLR
jgi:multicomponent Na+:H+ antiporter subunit D